MKFCSIVALVLGSVLFGSNVCLANTDRPMTLHERTNTWVPDPNAPVGVEVADTPDAVLELMTRPELVEIGLFRNLKPEWVIYLEVYRETYVFQGATKCASEDPRLKKYVYSRVHCIMPVERDPVTDELICPKPPGSLVGGFFGMVRAIPREEQLQDPCANDPEPEVPSLEDFDFLQ